MIPKRPGWKYEGDKNSSRRGGIDRNGSNKATITAAGEGVVTMGMRPGNGPGSGLAMTTRAGAATMLGVRAGAVAARVVS